MFKNKSGKKGYNGVLVFAAALGFLFMTSFVMANFVGYAGSEDDSASTNITTFNEDTVHLLQFNVNASDDANFQANITAVNVTFPSVFTLHEGSNITGIDGILGNSSATFSATVRSWANVSCGTTNAGLHCGLINASPTFGGFVNVNLTGNTPGKYNISVLVANDTDEYGDELNLTVHVNDTTAPHSVTFMPGVVSGANLSIAEIIINVSANDTHSGIGLANISLYLTNDTYTANNGARNSTIINSGGALNDTFWANFSGSHLVDGNYIINVTGINDNSDLINLGVNATNSTGVQLNVTIDTVSPVVTLAKSTSSTKTSLVIDVTVDESGTGIEGTCAIDNPGATIAGSGTTSQTVTDGQDLGCGESRSYTITCTDYSGNSGTKIETFTTDSCGGGGSSSGGGGGGGSASSWTMTYSDSGMELSDKGTVNRDLSKKHRIKLKVGGDIYYVGVTDLTGTTATLDVSPNQESTISVGSTQKFDITNDNVYDLAVTLNSIDSNKADLDVMYIQEAIPAEAEEPVVEEASSITGRAVDEEVSPEQAEKKRNSWAWVVLAVIAIGLIVFFTRKK